MLSKHDSIPSGTVCCHPVVLTGDRKSGVCTKSRCYITSEAQSSKLPLERPPTHFGQGQRVLQGQVFFQDLKGTFYSEHRPVVVSHYISLRFMDLYKTQIVSKFGSSCTICATDLKRLMNETAQLFWRCTLLFSIDLQLNPDG